MPYEIHIERALNNDSSDDNAISVDQWRAVVNEIDGLRLAASDIKVTNPHSGETLSYHGNDDDAEMLIDGQWTPVFRWTGDGISFNAPPSFDNPDDPIRLLAINVANKLNASVFGDEGEEYQ